MEESKAPGENTFYLIIFIIMETSSTPMTANTQPPMSVFKQGLRTMEKFIDFLNYANVDWLDAEKLTFENVMKAIELFK